MFQYVYGAVSPMQGELDWMITDKMNTANMSEFLARVSAAHRREFIVMVVDGASSHVSNDLVVPHTAVGLARDRRLVDILRERGLIRRPQDLGIDPRQATRNLLAARPETESLHCSSVNHRRRSMPGAASTRKSPLRIGLAGQTCGPPRARAS